MRYSDLIQFEPIESIIQLRDAEKEAEAIKHVSTYVISKGMASQINDLIIPHLQFNNPYDNKGVFIVGNYGTGKSHLMSVISSIAENKEIVDYVNNASVKEKTKEIAGKFKVLRMEIGATKMALRDIIVQHLENYLDEVEIDYTFSSMKEVSNNKDCLLEMMSEFEEVYPEQGLLIIVDELLDYLRGRKDTDIVNDLGFLREIGEVCKNSRFRFMAGIQEALFDNPKFEYVSLSLSRVSQRFEQVSITRQDVAFVVSERLLKKDERQKSMIRNHLEKFTVLYTNMNENMDKFVELYPIHPSFIDTFEKIYIAEKREILKTISSNMKKLIDKEVNENDIGLISYDIYWNDIKETPSLRSIPDIKDVVDKSSVLEDKIRTSFVRPQYTDMAIRIIHALSVNRLTTDDIYTKMGLTSEALKDELCLYILMPEFEANFLTSTIESILKNILKTVNSQFISFNSENQEYYLDLKKSIDYQAKINRKTEDLSHDTLNRYYFDVLTRVMECSDSTCVTNFKIWEHEIEWKEKRVGKLGYLFFGNSVDRPTAHPVRDFYLNFNNPFGNSKKKEEVKRDEVYYILKDIHEDFINALKLYAASRELFKGANGEAKKIYREYAERDYFKKISDWIRSHITSVYEVEYDGNRKKISEWISGKSLGRVGIRDIINEVASNVLANHFDEISHGYPEFKTIVTVGNRSELAKEAIKWISTTVKTDLGSKVLDGLSLLVGNNLRPKKSKYAKEILKALNNKAIGHVLNRNEIIYNDHDVEYGTQFRLEPEWIVVILASLVYTGDITLSIHGKKIDASNLEELARTNIKDLIEFKHIEKPKDLPLNALIVLFEYFDIPPGQITNPDLRIEGIKTLQPKVTEMLNEVVTLQHKIREGIICWGVNLIDESSRVGLVKNLENLKTFLEKLQVYNTVGKLKNFNFSPEEIKNQSKGKEAIIKTVKLLKTKEKISKNAEYIESAELILDGNNKWNEEVFKIKLNYKEHVARGNIDDSFISKSINELNLLKQSYINEYLDLHSKARLTMNEDRRKAQLMKDSRLEVLKKLKGIDILPIDQLEKFQNSLASLKTCNNLSKNDLNKHPLCPHCKFNPMIETKSYTVLGKLDLLEDRLEDLYRNWTKILIEHIEDPMSKKNIELLKENQKRILKELIESQNLPKEINSEFIITIKNVLSGLEKLEFDIKELKHTLYRDGNPCTIDELKKRFECFLLKEVQGKDKTKVRIIIK